MTLDNFREVIRALVPAAKTSVVSTSFLDLFINKAVKDVNQRTFAYVSNKKFDVSADVGEYEISSKINDFVVPAESGLWWNEGTVAAPSWKRLDAVSRHSLNTQFPQWLNDGSDSPLRYFIESDILTVNPTPNTALTDGFWMFYVKQPTAMTEGGQYPFSGTTTQITSLEVLDDAIIDYVRWKLSIPLEAKQVGLLTMKEYEESVARRHMLLRLRPDVTGNQDRMRGPHIGR